MSIPKTIEQISKHKKDAISAIDTLLDKYITSNPKKADILSYWLEDYSRFLDYESEFDPHHLKRYKRGEVIKANLGFNVGSEEGGLHYCVVIEKNNPLSSPVLNVIPLTSSKSTEKKQCAGRVFIGDDLKNKVEDKCNMLIKKAYEKFSNTAKLLEDFSNGKLSIESAEIDNTTIEEIKQFVKALESAEKVSNEASRMKDGSIALVNQITTISKIRIYDPKTNKDILSNIRLSDESLNKIDAEIKKLFTY